VKKEPIIELELDSVLKELEMSMDEFVDFCILCGSDYTKSIDGLGPSTAYKMIKEFKNIEGVLEEIKDINNQRAKDNKPPKYELPDVSRYNYKAARNEFKGARVVDSTNLVVIVSAETDRVRRRGRSRPSRVPVHGEAVRRDAGERRHGEAERVQGEKGAVHTRVILRQAHQGHQQPQGGQGQRQRQARWLQQTEIRVKLRYSS
jgi:hypothetical protein